MGKTVRNLAWYKANEERKRSNVAVPHRDKSRYARKDWRRQVQRGMVDA